MLVPLQSAAARCSGAAVRLVCVPLSSWSLVRLYRVLLECGPVRVVCAVSGWPAGAAAGCCFRVVLLSKGCLHLSNLGAATGYGCQSAVHCEAWVRVSLLGVAARCRWQRVSWAMVGITFCAVAEKGERLVATKTLLLSGVCAGAMYGVLM